MSFHFPDRLGEGEAPAEPQSSRKSRLGRSLAVPALAALLICLCAPEIRADPCPCTTVDAITKGEQKSSPVEVTSAAPDQQDRRVLHVYADPDNLPFSNNKLEGFENKIAELVAKDLGLKLQYTWLVQHRGFFRESLKDGDGDLVMGVPADFERALPTRPYYRSTYVFVYRKESGLHLHGFSDPALKKLKIGIQIVGGDNTPPAHALAANGIIDNVIGYPVFVHEGQSPSAKLVEDVGRGVIDVAVVWGPSGAYFARKQAVPLEVATVGEVPELPALHFAFDISIGVRKRDKALRDKLNEVLTRRSQEIQKILDDYGVPRVTADPQSPAASGLRH